MDVGADNFRFTLEDKNGLKKPCRTYRKAKTTNLHINSLDRYLPREIQTLVSTGPGVLGFLNFPSQTVAQTAGPIMMDSQQNSALNCLLQRGGNLSSGYYSRVALTDMTINLQLFNILGSYNNSFFIEVYQAPTPAPPANTNGTVYLISIPSGCYNYERMANALDVALTAIGVGDWTVLPPLFSGTNQTGFLIVGPAPQGGNNTYFRLVAVPTFGTYGDEVTPQLLQANSRFLRFMGFNNPTSFGYADPTVTTTPTTNGAYGTGIAGAIPNFCYTNYIDVYSVYLTNYKDAKDTNTSLQANTGNIARIYMTEAPLVGTNFNYVNGQQSQVPPDRTIVGIAPTIITKKWQNPNWCQWSPNQTINQVDITLRAQDGNILNWSALKQTEWSGTITLTE